MPIRVEHGEEATKHVFNQCKTSMEKDMIHQPKNLCKIINYVWSKTKYHPMLHLRYFFVLFNDSQSIDDGGIYEDFMDNTRRACCSQFMKHHPNVLLERQGFYYLNTSPLDKEDFKEATEFVCGCSHFVLMTGYFPHFLHSITALTIMSPNPYLDEDN